ncbi:hypothetical protein [Pseudomonas sp. LF-5]|uniref:hypothetical protein n=1 Tax=Pseudomonas TaxID=286 RepID=UPI0030955600
MISVENMQVEYLQDLKTSGVDLDYLAVVLKDLSTLRLEPTIEKLAAILVGEVLSSKDALKLANAKGAARGYALGVGVMASCDGLEEFFKRLTDRAQEQLLQPYRPG